MASDRVARHYRRDGLVAAIADVLRRAGKDPDRLAPADLAAIDEFHVRGREATAELAAALDLAPDSQVLDVGCGLGGPSRHLAARHGCRVVGVDLTVDYCRAAAALGRATGLSDKAAYAAADALALPFAAATFDVAWTQHAAMNIAEKHALYAELRRVLAPGGRFALYDVLQGPAGPPEFPLPWAREPAISHLATPDELRRALAGAGFVVAAWTDTTAAGQAWFTRAAARATVHGPPPLGPALLLGPDFGTMARNLRRGLEKGRLLLAQVVCRRR